MSRMATPTFPGQMFRDSRQFDYGSPSTETVNRIAGSISPGAGAVAPENPWKQTGANEREAAKIRQPAAKADAAAFADWYPKLTTEQHDAFSGGHKVGENADLFGSFPVESSPGVQNSGVNKAASAGGPLNADNIEGITRTAAQQYFLRQLNLGTQGTPAASAGTAPTSPAAPASPSSPSSPQLGPVTAAPAAGSDGFSPVATRVGNVTTQPIAPAGAPAPAPAAPLPSVEPYAQQHQAYQQQLSAVGQPSAAPTAAPDMSYLQTLYARATTPADRAAILRTIAATHGNQVRQQIAEGTNDTRKDIAGETNTSREKVAGANNDNRTSIAASNNAAKTQIAQMHSKDLLAIANNANDTRKDIAQEEIEQRDRAIGEAERHHRGMEEEASQKLQQHGNLTPEDVARYRADFDKINQMRELHGLTPHPYPDYLSQSPTNAPATPPAASPAPTAAPAAAPAAPDATRFVAGPNGLFIHPDLPNVTYRKVPGGYQRVQ